MTTADLRTKLLNIKGMLAAAIPALDWAKVGRARDALGVIIDGMAPPGGSNTGLAWLSGVGDSNPDGDDFDGATSWAARLGVPAVDIVTSFMVHDTKKGVLNRAATKAGAWGKLAAAGVKLCQMVPIVTAEDVPNAAAFIGSDAHRTYLRQFYTILAAAGHTDARLRLGHEMNGGHYPWAQLSPALYKQAFIVADQEARPILPDFRSIFNPLRGGSVLAWYPGDAVTDLIGVDWYDNGGLGGVGYVSDQASWNKGYMVGTDADPHGWGRWLAFAQSRDKKLCVPEWGFGHGSQVPPGPEEDVPGYVPVFKAWLNDNAADIDFETYFNNGRHQINPNGNPNIVRSEAAYFSTWTK